MVYIPIADAKIQMMRTTRAAMRPMEPFIMIGKH